MAQDYDNYYTTRTEFCFSYAEVLGFSTRAPDICLLEILLITQGEGRKRLVIQTFKNWLKNLRERNKLYFVNKHLFLFYISKSVV